MDIFQYHQLYSYLGNESLLVSCDFKCDECESELNNSVALSDHDKLINNNYRNNWQSPVILYFITHTDIIHYSVCYGLVIFLLQHTNLHKLYIGVNSWI